jgi:CRISPR-associated endonuclease/helicase Cas3
MILAHREKNSEGYFLEQSLDEHLYEVGKRAGQIGSEIGLEAFMKLAGYLHDSGKADRAFQFYINGQSSRQVNHSSAGGRVLEDLINSDQELLDLKFSKPFRYFQEVLTYIIFAHHGLYDQVAYGSTEHKSYLRLHYDDGDYHYKEDVLAYILEFDIRIKQQGQDSIIDLIKRAYQEFETVYGNILKLSSKNCNKERRGEEKEYYISCLTRLCLSILKEADIYDSSNAFHKPKQHLWEAEQRSKVWDRASERIEYIYKEYKNSPMTSEINRTRNILADLVREAAILNDYGIYKLELPTGAGKTKCGLRYAVTNARKYNRNRIFYITAFLSVLEQNAAEIRSIIDQDEVILEHHSNMIDELQQNIEISNDSEEYRYRSYLMDSWENLIILTTMVQFFNTLFKEKSSQIRRFCKLINSVIIIDEVQSLPLKVLSNFNLMMNFMKEIMHCNIVHCTATQPVLDNEAMRYKIYYGDKEDYKTMIVNEGHNWTECFKRVDFYNLTGRDALKTLSTEELSAYIKAELSVFDSCLVVLNTKASVAKIYNYLEDNFNGVEIIYLTTNLCAAHRLQIISDMKEKLRQNRKLQAHNKIICISTQLIEAGVDVDFDVVFRTLAGIDSLIQCAGRCNREGKLMLNGNYVHGKLVIIRYQDENLVNLPDIKAMADAAEYAIRKHEDRLGEESLLNIDILQKPYFDKYYIQNINKLDYIDYKRNSSMLEELGKNQPARNAYSMVKHKEQKPMMFQAFLTSAENFQLIGNETVGVIVEYNNKDLLERLEIAMMNREYALVRNLLQQLQRFTVNMYPSPKLIPYISKNDDYNVYFMQKEYYNVKKGVVIDQLADLIV